MKFAKETESDVEIATPLGELDASTLDDFRGELAQLATGSNVVIDLRSLPFMDTAGLGALIGGVRKIRESEGEVVVVCGESPVHRLLMTSRFDRMVDVFDGADDAVEHFADHSVSQAVRN